MTLYFLWIYAENGKGYILDNQKFNDHDFDQKEQNCYKSSKKNTNLSIHKTANFIIFVCFSNYEISKQDALPQSTF